MKLFCEKASCPKEQELADLFEQIQQIRGRLARANSYFNYTKEPDIVEACVLEIAALEKRHEYLLRTYRRLEQQASSPALAVNN